MEVKDTGHGRGSRIRRARHFSHFDRTARDEDGTEVIRLTREFVGDPGDTAPGARSNPMLAGRP
ncbi:hypothetical protein, partial [Streptomyces sp. NPDC000851]